MEAILDNLTPEEIELFGNTPVLPPPPGVKSNFVDPPSQGPIAIWTTSILIAVALFFYLNRMYIKARLMKSWTWDDCKLEISNLSRRTKTNKSVTLTLAMVSDPDTE